MSTFNWTIRTASWPDLAQQRIFEATATCNDCPHGYVTTAQSPFLVLSKVASDMESHKCPPKK